VILGTAACAILHANLYGTCTHDIPSADALQFMSSSPHVLGASNLLAAIDGPHCMPQFMGSNAWNLVLCACGQLPLLAMGSATSSLFRKLW
jgi:hypothetical protein